MRGKLRNKILGMMVLVSVLPVVALGVSALFSLNLFHKIDIASIEDNLIDQKVEEIRRFMDELIGTLELKVGFEQTGDIELSHQRFLLKQFLKELPDVEEIAFLNLSGRETARFSREFPDGVPAEELEDKSKIKRFQVARSGKNYIGRVQFTLRGPLITIATPVLNRNNIVISVLASHVSLKKLSDTIERSRLGKDGYIYLVEQDGFVVAGSSRAKGTKPNLLGIGFVSELLEGIDHQGVGGQRRYRSFWGTPVVAAGRYIPDLGLGIVAEWPESDADRILITLQNQILVAAFLVLGATILVSFFLANRIVRPIKVLEAGTRLVAEGKFDKPVQILTHDEIEELGLAFNKMMAGLKRLEELKDEFVFIAAHELRTPVNAIKGFVSMVQESETKNLTEQGRSFLIEVKKASERLGQLVNDLLQIARSEAGRLEIKTVPLNVTLPVRAVLTELSPLAKEKSIELVCEPVQGLPQVIADQDRLKEVLVNLVGNAIKYTLGAGTVTVSHEMRGNELITHVKDTGLGISKEAQKKLFEKFYRVQTEKTREITGTGLGLFIVKELIEKMGGRIWVESEEGKGSTFSFSLKIA